MSEFTISQAREFLAAAEEIRSAVRGDLANLSRSQAVQTHAVRNYLRSAGEWEISWREIANLPSFDHAADALATVPEGDNYGDFVRHVIERARTAVNNYALAHGGDLLLGAP